MGQTKKQLKPFLTISDISEEFITIGITSKFRVEIPNEDGVRGLDDFHKITPHLDRLGLMNEIEGGLTESNSRTSSFLSLISNKPIESLNKIQNVNVLLLGVGGLGSRIALELAALNIKSITVVDPSRLSVSNLQRMYYYNSSDVNKEKVLLIKEKVRQISPTTQVNSVFGDSIDFALTQNLSAFDFIFITADADDGTMGNHIGSKLKKSGVPHLIGGYWESKLIVGPLIDKSSETDLEQQYKKHREKVPRKPIRDFTPPSIGYSNSIISGIMLNEMVKYIVTDKSDLVNKQLQIDVLDLSQRIVNTYD